MAIRTFADLLAEAQARGPLNVAVAAAQDEAVLLAAADAQKMGIARMILVGDEPKIRALADEHEIDLSDMEILHEPDPQAAAQRTMLLVREDHADIAMKGKLQTADFLLAALNRETGVRAGRLFSHVAAFEIPQLHRLILISDAGVVVAPTLEQKVEIVRNAVMVAHAIGIEQPRVAILAASEMVNPKIPATLDAANLAKMADRGQITGCLIDGPLAIDNAISEVAAQIKGIESDVAGRADILIAPDIEAGNILAKGITYFAGGKMAGIVVGGQVPLILPSRSDSHEAKLVALSLGVLVSS